MDFFHHKKKAEGTEVCFGMFQVQFMAFYSGSFHSDTDIGIGIGIDIDIGIINNTGIAGRDGQHCGN